MYETTPRVFCIAEPMINLQSLSAYLESVNGDEWMVRQDWNSPGEDLTEIGGRLCYRSWKPGLNANVQKVRTDRKDYFANILKSGHGSVLEHANYSFIFHDVSRVFTHELVRHRAGVAISQESLRFVRLTDLGFRIPPILKELHTATDMRHSVVSLVEKLEEFQLDAAEHYDLDNPEVPFHVRKEVTSALRRLAPLGLSTGMLWTANLRTLRHVINMRTAPGAEEEIRLVFGHVAQIMQQKCPLLFQDMTIADDGSCWFHWPKV